MNAGPFRAFLEALGRIQAQFPEEGSPIRTALVTARGAPAHRRVINTLRSWQVRIDETFFLGGVEKADVLRALRPHIFFDDQMRHLELAAEAVPSAHVMTSEQLQLLPAEALPPREKPRRTRRRATTEPAVAAPSPRADSGESSRRRERLARSERAVPAEPPAKPARRRRSKAVP